MRLRYSILLGLAALYFFFAATAGAQVFDPDPSEPNAQAVAEFRASGAFVGLTPPPVGWLCTATVVFFGPVPIQDFVCEPDPALIEQQQRERQEWERRQAENGRRVYERLRRAR